MPEIEEYPAPELPVFFIIESSSAMNKSQIDFVNETMPYLIDCLEKINYDVRGRYSIKVSILTYNDTSHWMSEILLSPEELKNKWVPLKSSGNANYEFMCIALEEAMHKRSDRLPKGQLCSLYGHKVPIVVLITNSIGNEKHTKEFEKLNINSWFHESNKIILSDRNIYSEDNIDAFTGRQSVKKTLVTWDDSHLFANLVLDECNNPWSSCACGSKTYSRGQVELEHNKKDENNLDIDDFE